MSSSAPRRRWLWPLLAFLTAAFVITVIFRFRAKLERPFLRLGGGVFQAVSQNPRWVVGVSVIVVGLVWLAIGIKCFVDWRRESRS